jgi:hypothetical protein
MGNQNDFDTCNANCTSEAKTASLSQYSSALGCGQQHCLGLNDAGPAKCALSSDRTKITELDGSPIQRSSACGTCLDNALQALFGGNCSPANSPDCNPTECTAVFNACLTQ